MHTTIGIDTSFFHDFKFTINEVEMMDSLINPFTKSTDSRKFITLAGIDGKESIGVTEHHNSIQFFLESNVI